MRKLYFSNGSPFARRVRIVLEEKALEYDQDIFDALRPIDQIKEITPTLQVPVLQDAGRTLWSSDLIIAYLFENYPKCCSRDMEWPLAGTVYRPTFRWEDQPSAEPTSGGDGNGVASRKGLQKYRVVGEAIGYYDFTIRIVPKSTARLYP